MSASYTEAWVKYGIPLDLNYICREASEFERFLTERRYPVDGIFEASDRVAISVFGMLASYGLQVPKDIKLIGFANSDYSKISYPAISTVDIHPDQLAKKAVS